jgi:FAD binding domain
MNDIPEEALKSIEESFGTRFVRHAASEPDDAEPFASVFPERAEEVESLTRLAARHRIPLVARGAGTALYPGKAPRALVVRFDAMRRIRLMEESGEPSVEVEPGSLGGSSKSDCARGVWDRRSTPPARRGPGSYEYGWLLQNVLWAEVVLAGGGRDLIEGETLRHFVGSRGTTGFFVGGTARDEAGGRGRTRGGSLPARRRPRGGHLGSLPKRGTALAPWLHERRNGARQDPRGRSRALRRLPGIEDALGRACS